MASSRGASRERVLEVSRPADMDPQPTSDSNRTALAAEMAGRVRSPWKVDPAVARTEAIGTSHVTQGRRALSQLPKLVCHIRAHAPEGSK